MNKDLNAFQISAAFPSGLVGSVVLNATMMLILEGGYAEECAYKIAASTCMSLLIITDLHLRINPNNHTT